MSTAETTSQITDQREAVIKRIGGEITWRVTEFDYGRHYTIDARGPNLNFDAHFDPQQFRSLQAMFAAGYEDES